MRCENQWKYRRSIEIYLCGFFQTEWRIAFLQTDNVSPFYAYLEKYQQSMFLKMKNYLCIIQKRVAKVIRHIRIFSAGPYRSTDITSSYKK